VIDERDGMRIEWDVPIRMDDGVTLRADIYRPVESGTHPVLLTYGPYAKGLPFQDGYPDSWEALVRAHPEVAEGTTAKYVTWETPDPEKWVPDGYVVLRVDARGWGRSPGFIEPYSPREIRDLFACIEWAGTRPWSTGKVGLLGISYFAVNQWLVAGLQPPHLAAMVPWEGLGDQYRDSMYHGGIMTTSVDVWFRRTITTIQHGRGTRDGVNPNTGELYNGPETLSDEKLALNRSNYPGTIRGRRLFDEFYRARSADWSKITVPFLASGNWGGHGKHLRGAVEAFTRATSTQKWLEIHGEGHWVSFYTGHGVALQKRFFDHFLKGVDNGWDHQPPVILRVRTLDGFVDRSEQEWPLARTKWTRMFLDSAAGRLSDSPGETGEQSGFEAPGDGVTFYTEPVVEETEITGPVSVKLFVSSSTEDADLFLVVSVFGPDDREVVFQGAVDPHTPIAQGWLRASHRTLDPELTTEYRPYHTHDAVRPLVPGEIYELDVEIWPTCIVVPAGYRIALTVRGRDYEYADLDEAPQFSHFKGSQMRGSGIYVHDDPGDRPPEVFGGTTTIHTGAGYPSHVLLPVIPAGG